MEVKYDKDYYYKFHRFVQSFMKLLYKINVRGLDNIPKDENYIMAGNHLNILDSWLLLTYVDDYVRFMVDNKLYRYKSWEKFFKRLGTFGINPDDLDVIGLKTAFELLKQGENICIFPEGHTHSRLVNLEYKPGVARLSKMADVPVVPFNINGSYKPFHELDLVFGEPINYKHSFLNKHDMDIDLETRIKSLRL